MLSTYGCFPAYLSASDAYQRAGAPCSSCSFRFNCSCMRSCVTFHRVWLFFIGEQRLVQLIIHFCQTWGWGVRSGVILFCCAMFYKVKPSVMLGMKEQKLAWFWPQATKTVNSHHSPLSFCVLQTRQIFRRDSDLYWRPVTWGVKVIVCDIVFHLYMSCSF